MKTLEPRLILQHRDKNLLDLLSRYQLLSTTQIARLLFQDTAHTTMMRRLRMLEKQQLIHRGVALESGINTWIIGKNARMFFGFERSRATMNRNSIGHDVAVTDIHLSLEKLNLFFDFKSEWELRSELGRGLPLKAFRDEQIPDLLIHAQAKGDKNEKVSVAVEVERTRKSSRRYYTIFMNYWVMRKVNYLWYIVGSREVGNAILKNVKATGFPLDKLLITLEADFDCDLESLKVYAAGSKTRLLLRELFQSTIP